MTATEILRANIDKLSPKDRGFAESLLKSADRASTKQMYWIEQLAKRATAPAKPVVKAAVSLDGLYGLLETAGKKLRFPIIRYFTKDGRELRFYLSGPKSSVPGVVNVKGTDDRWYGRVLRDGTWQGRSPYAEVSEPVELLATDPIKVLAENGKLANRCCFCGLTLTDERSVNAGYGPVCADHWNLPWGVTKTEVA